jgi:hypothetical protein
MTQQDRTALDSNRDLLGLYVVIEPNALDGKDELFVDTASSLTNQPQNLWRSFACNAPMLARQCAGIDWRDWRPTLAAVSLSSSQPLASLRPHVEEMYECLILS